MRYSSRFFLYAPLGLFLAIMTVIGVHWWVVADAFAAKLDAANGHAIAPGVTLRFASRSISGFPFSLDTVMRDVSFEIATPHGPVLWRTQDFAMHALSYGREQSIFEAAGRQELDWTGAGGERRRLVFAVGSLHASAVEDKGGLARFDLDLVGFGSKALTARRLQLHLRRDPAKNAFDLVAAADDVHAAAQSCPSLDDHIAAGRLVAIATPAAALARLRAGAQDWGEAVAQWRMAGGAFRISELSLTSGSPARLRAALGAIPAQRLFDLSDLLDALCGVPPY